jgi:hypothetical protein
VKHGLRLDIGSWKIMAMSLPMILRRSSADMVQKVAALEGHPDRRVTFAVGGRRPITASIDTDLPEPRLAHDREHLALVHAAATRCPPDAKKPTDGV